MKNFSILGVAGYIAPRHIQAIHESGNKLVCAMDPNDSVGILDRYTRDVAFFTDFERYEDFIESVKGTERQIEYTTICSPNFLHHSHMRLAMNHGCDVICEKPLALTESELDDLLRFEDQYKKKISTILQLRVHESILKLKNKIDKSAPKEKYDIELTYLTSRGPWYFESWKGDPNKSGGLITNIGIHFFDMLTWIFGKEVKSELHIKTNSVASGYLELERARVKWLLSIDFDLLPESVKKAGKTTFRSIKIDGEELEFSTGFTDLHTTIYKNVLNGKVFSVEDTRESTRIVEELRSASILGVNSNSHQLARGL